MEGDTKVRKNLVNIEISELEDEIFQKRAFQVYIIFVFLSAVGILSWASLYFNLPI